MSIEVLNARTLEIDEDVFLQKMEKTITPVMIRLNDARTRVNGTSSLPQEYPLPGGIEVLRAFVKRHLLR